MDQNAPDARQRVVTELLKSAAAICPPDCPADLESFLGQYFRNIPLPDLKARDPGDLAGAALGHLAFGQKRKPGKVMARIFNPVKDEDGWESKRESKV